MHSLKKAKKQLLFSSIIRLFIFIGMIAGMYFGYPNTQIILASIILGIVLFIVLVNRHSNLSYERNKLQKLISLNELELAVFNDDYKDLIKGKEYIDPSHPYSHDIDLFGDRSFFQYINRTATNAGQEDLATILCSNDIEDINSKQQGIKNISKLAEWRQEFSAIASLVDVTVPISNIRNWLQNYVLFVPKIMRVLPTIVSTVSVVMIVLLFMEVINFQLFLMWFFVGLSITASQLKKINALYVQANKVKDTFEQYYKLVDLIEKGNFDAPLLQKKQQNVINEAEKASIILKKFASILNALDQRNNMLFGIFANGLLLWDITQCYRIEK